MLRVTCEFCVPPHPLRVKCQACNCEATHVAWRLWRCNGCNRVGVLDPNALATTGICPEASERMLRGEPMPVREPEPGRAYGLYIAVGAVMAFWALLIVAAWRLAR